MSIGNSDDLQNLKNILPAGTKFWIGLYRSPAADGKFILSDGRRQILETDSGIRNLISDPDRMLNRNDCANCDCAYYSDEKISFVPCSEVNIYILSETQRQSFIL